MITSADSLAYAITGAMQNGLAAAVAGKVPLINLNTAEGSSLAHDLRSGYPIPRSIALDYTPLFDILHLASYGQQGLNYDAVVTAIIEPFDILRDIFERVDKIDKDDKDDKKIKVADPRAMLGHVLAFFTGEPAFAPLLGTFGSFLEGQFGIALSLVTTLKNLAGPSFPRAIADAALAYFFNPTGFTTVDEIQITPPMQFSGTPQTPGDLKGSLASRSSDRYLRDLIGITLEAAGDVQFQLRDRYHRMLTHLTLPQQEVAKRWFKGFASMAEAGVLTAVEETLLGIGEFTTNPLIAAAAGSYAGTIARKATQHVFLNELNV
ncbi:MAG: hypothetical protein ABSG46_10795 [Candidatus Binataceae bacterium]